MLLTVGSAIIPHAFRVCITPTFDIQIIPVLGHYLVFVLLFKH